ncbi:MAG: helicase [Gemmatimonadota bacterium]|nr:helicase [Gemmatimonadota bacterium]MDH3478656.1 helicase [Gemmatimonadota bacterium]MDH3569316.1 helicase [Gemmatimonadota bacterium]MDH5550509.1 helicase [Gemmatimonadota bacterium]
MTTLSSEVRAIVAAEIAAAGGREVSFMARVDEHGVIVDARAVARGTASAVLALPGVATRGEIVLHNHPSGDLDPSVADLDVAARMHDGGVGFGIVDNAAEHLYMVVEVPRPRETVAIDPVAAADALGPGGIVAGVLGEFEDRASQRDMAAYVADVYNDGGVSLLEAGTGVGKSFAYLVPAIEWSYANGERTVVSTNTINLQEQLVGKDLPLLARAFVDRERPPTYALLKGWNNYLCLARLQLALGGQASLLEPERQGELVSLAEWAAHTTDGSLADLVDQPSFDVWEEVRAEGDLCTRLECAHFDRCFLFEARRRAAEADVVVVNHHLLAADLAVRRVQDNWQEAAVLPPYRRLVLDEGHHLEDVAAQHLGTQVTSRGMLRVLGRLERNGRGQLPTLLAELARADDLLSSASAELIRTALLPTVGETRGYVERTFQLLAERLMTAGGGVLRLDDGFASDPIWAQGLGVALDNVVGTLGRLRDGVETVADRLELTDEPDRRSQIVGELRAVVRRLEAAADGFALTLRPQAGLELVRWIERRGDRPAGGLPFGVALSAVPLDLAGILRESLFDRVQTVVVTSATLAVGGTYDFLRDRVGLSLPPDPVKYAEVLPSPFDFGRQCLFGVPTDLPDPRSNEGGHDLAVAQGIRELAAASDGGMFVLFTSHAQLRRVAAMIRGSVTGRWPLLVQGEGPRDYLLRRFRDLGSAILLGTDSFWEGVDVPGRSLRVLLLAKLPFKVPSEPLTAARLEALQARGLDGFRHYLLPLAALKLKQGFGRLIRSKTDVGVVILMDHRIVKRNYGEILLGSLPPADRVIGPWETVRQAAEEFFALHGIGAPT